MPRKILRQVDSFAPTESAEQRRRMPLGTTVSRYVLRLTGTLTVGVAAATILEDSPLGFLRNIAVVLNGSFPLMALDARGLFFWNRLLHRTAPQITAPSGAVGASAFVAEMEIPFGQPDLDRPLDSAFWLDTRLLSSLEVVFTTGAAVDVATAGGGGTVTLSLLNITIFAEEVADVGGPTSRMQLTRVQQAITATGDLDIQLPPLGPIYRAILLHFTSANADPIRATSDDTILSTASLIADNVVRHVDASPYRMLRADNKMEFGVETLPAGWAVLNFAKSRNLRDVILTSRTRQLITRLTIAAAPANTFVQLYPVSALLVVRGQGRR